MTTSKGVIFLLPLHNLKVGTEPTCKRGRPNRPCTGAVDGVAGIQLSKSWTICRNGNLGPFQLLASVLSSEGVYESVEPLWTGTFGI